MDTKTIQRIFTGCIVLLLMLLAGCDRNRTHAEESNRVITDMAGNRVSIPAPENIQRAAVIFTPVGQIAYILGVQDKLCAVTRQVKMYNYISRFDPEIKNVSTPVSGWEVNVEELLATKPDICIGIDRQLSRIAKVSTIPSLCVGFRNSDSDIEYQKKLVRFFGDVFGKEERAEKYCGFLEQSLEIIAGRVDLVQKDRRPRVLIASEHDHSGTYGKDSYIQEWLERAGCRNAAETLIPPGSSNSFNKVSPEQMLAWDPDIILITSGTINELENNNAWSGFRAVQNKKVYRIPVGIFIWNRPTAEGSALFPFWMAATAYPELFTDITAESHIRRFWKEILKYDLTDEDVYDILHPVERPF